MITLFKKITEVGQPINIKIQDALDGIKNCRSKHLIERIRLETDKEARNKMKVQLPVICWSGTFARRNNASLKIHSGFICLDFDDVDLKLKEDLKKDKFIFAAFVSPSGNGIKALVKIPIGPKLDHLASFKALKERYPNIDQSCKDVARCCFVSYDPDIYINYDAEVFTTQIVSKIETYEVKRPEDDKETIYENLKKWLDSKGEYFTTGNRNNFLCKIAAACNRFGIGEDDCKSRLLMDFVNGSSGFELSEFEAVVSGVYSRYKGDWNTAEFEKKEIVQRQSRKVIKEEILDLSQPAKDVIYLRDVQKDMFDQFKDGIKKGAKTGIDEIDEIFRWIKGELNVWYGIANHGKSMCLMDMMMRKSMEEDWSWALFSPEQYPPHRFYNDLIQNYIGKKVFGRNKMSDEEYLQGMQFVNDHFYYLYPKEESPTPEYINERFREIIKKHNIDGVVVDPFNQLYHKGRGAREDQYLEVILSNFKQFALRENIIYNVVAHTNGKVEKADGELVTPYYIWQLAGGMMWGNKVDNILCYHRPHYQNDPDCSLAILESQKIKNRQLNGKPGKVHLEFDIDRHRFFTAKTDSDFSPDVSDAQIKFMNREVEPHIFQ